MSIRQAIHEKERQLAESYVNNVAGAQQLQRTLERDILPGMVDELGLDEEGEQRAWEWLNDLRMCIGSYTSFRLVTLPLIREESIFRLLRVRLFPMVN